MVATHMCLKPSEGTALDSRIYRVLSLYNHAFNNLISHGSVG